MWRLKEYSRAVTGVRLTTAGAAMLQVQENLNRLFNNARRLPPSNVSDKTNTTGIMLMRRII